MKDRENKKSWIAYVSSFPPRECGIATFTEDLTGASDELFSGSSEAKIVAVNSPNEENTSYPPKVIGAISQHDKESYVKAALLLNNNPKVRLICVQHEFGLFGGDYGIYIVDFLRALKKPAVLVFHTVLPNPAPKLRETVILLAHSVAKVVTMTSVSRDILQNDYGIRIEKITVIPHGIHAMPYSKGEEEKREIGVEGRIIVSTFGLLGPGKGIEYALDALPPVVTKFPKVLYLVIGATHPVVARNDGERYRQALEEKVRVLGLENHVRFHNKYLETKDLLSFLTATDLYLSLSQNPDQAVSGTLSYALGTGRAVLSTAFAQARQDVPADVGTLVPIADSAAITHALTDMLSNQDRLRDMGKNAYFRTRHMTWENVALSYMKEYLSLAPELEGEEKNIPEIKLDHLSKMTDSFGMLQFARLTEPDPASGYTLDDNARALQVVAYHYDRFQDAESVRLGRIYLLFLSYITKKDGGFYNYVDDKRSFMILQNEKENLEDSCGRGLLALATVATSTMPEEFRSEARRLLELQLGKQIAFTSPRASAFLIKALSLLLSRYPQGTNHVTYRALLGNQCDRLLELFRSGDAEWPWFEEVLAYSNGLLPESLLRAYEVTKNEDYKQVGLQSLDFLLAHSMQGDVCAPIGQSGWFKRGGVKHLYDQQPEEVFSLVCALLAAYDVTRDECHRALMYKAFNWFLGNNHLNQVVYDQTTGGCFDGVGEKEINLNQGAESTVVYLLARFALENI